MPSYSLRHFACRFVEPLRFLEEADALLRLLVDVHVLREEILSLAVFLAQSANEPFFNLVLVFH